MESSAYCNYKRCDSPTTTRGRHLRATKRISKGQTIFVEKPLLSLQSLGNAHTGALVCRCCRAFVGGPDLCVSVASGRISRDQIWNTNNNNSGGSGVKNTSWQIVPCRNKCGEVFCSKECEENMWNCCGHDLLCTGLIPDDNHTVKEDDKESEEETKDNAKDGNNSQEEEEGKLHPLIQFKVHALQSNEILLMVGDMIATIVSLRRQQLEADYYHQQKSREYASANNTSNLEDIIAPYLDFTLVPWWEVATKPLLNDPSKSTEVKELNEALRNICAISADLLKEAFLSTIPPPSNHNSNNNHKREGTIIETGTEEQEKLFSLTLQQAIQECEDEYDMFNGLFIGKIIGSFEQNAMGIRARHPLCRDILEDKDFRKRYHSDIIKCIELAGMIGGEDGDDNDEDEDPHNVDDEEGTDEQNVNGDDHDHESQENKEKYEQDYSVDDIAAFISEFTIDETGNSAGENVQIEDINEEVHEDCCGEKDESTEEHNENHCDERGDCCGGEEERNKGKELHGCCNEDSCHDENNDKVVEMNDDNDCNEDCHGCCDEDGCHDEEKTPEKDINYENDMNQTGDDPDMLFTPLDGTTMYATTCKMNHSCNPNVVPLYEYSCSGGGKYARWGQKFPLVISCRALRDIEEDEELCISYIESNQSLEKRRDALLNYGFWCVCDKCVEEESADAQINASVTQSLNQMNIEDDLFGEESEEDDLFGGDSEDESDQEDTEKSETADTSNDESGEQLLATRVVELDKLSISYDSCSIPLQALVTVSTYVVQVGKQILQNIQKRHSGDESNQAMFLTILNACIGAVKERNFISCIREGTRGEALGLEKLKENGAWLDSSHREYYCCCAITSALGFAYKSNFIAAMEMLDKLSIFGFSREDINDFYNYVEAQSSCSYYFHTSKLKMTKLIPNYKKPQMQSLVNKGLSNKILYPIEEVDVEVMTLKLFKESFELPSKPVVIRGYASSWPAVNKWRNLSYITERGYRVVPIERGLMFEDGGMKEEMMTIRNFVHSFLYPSCSREVWPLPSPNSSTQDPVAYLAQHKLFEQIPNLLEDLNYPPSLCGKNGPSHVNAWIGTGGTRTPLHFDSYDNLFVQITGAKYIRLYDQSETPKLYVLSKHESSYGSQGNMSAVNCEQEDFEKHPMSKNAKFTEVLMLPGDCLFIPSKTWHYVRGITTSMSVNFWF